MVPPVRFFQILLLTGLAGCQCVTVPPRQYRCEPGDDACVATDAGVPDSGLPDAGLPDAAVPGPCDGGPCRFTDAGVCADWGCVDALWGPTSALPPPTIGARNTPIPPGLDGGVYGWFGGVLLPDGRVLAVAHTADRFLTYDPRSHEVASIGPQFSSPLRKYAGAVLAPNGLVYAFPYQARQLLEIDPLSGLMNPVGPQLSSSDGGDPLYVGGVVDAFGRVWTVSEAHEAMPILRFDPGDGGLTRFNPVGSAPWGGWWGMARLPDDRLLTFPKEYFADPTVLSPSVMVITPHPGAADFEQVAGFDMADAGSGLQGGSLTRAGSVCSTPAGLTSKLVFVRLESGALAASDVDTVVTGFGFAATDSDGFVMTTPDLNDEVAVISSDGGVTLRRISGQRYGYLGLIATPQGMVGIPGGPPAGFLLLQPGTALDGGVFDRRPMPVLLSPWFNKL